MEKPDLYKKLLDDMDWDKFLVLLENVKKPETRIALYLKKNYGFCDGLCNMDDDAWLSDAKSIIKLANKDSQK